MSNIKTLKLLRKRLKQSKKLATILKRDNVSENLSWSILGIKVAMEKARRQL